MAKDRRILCCDGIADRGLEILSEIAEVDVSPKGLSGDELRERLAPCEAVVVRSATKIGAEDMDAAPSLRAIARAGVGVDNIDVSAATARGIVVINSPDGNTVSAAEHTMAMLLSVARKVPAADAKLREGGWARKEFVGSQLQGKTLGVVGCGKIGGEVVKRAQAFGMSILAFDPYISDARADQLGVQVVSFETLLEQSHFVTLHAPKVPATMGLIGEDALAMMRPGAAIVNCARGGLVDEDALADALRSGRLSGAALDVFAAEPDPPTHLMDVPNLVITPHLGASTEEAQEFVAVDVAEQIVDIVEGRLARTAVNAPAISPEMLREMGPYLDLVSKVGRLHSTMLAGPIESVEIVYSGDVTDEKTEPLRLWTLVGLLSPLRSYPVNLVNAPTEAENWGITVTEGTGSITRGFESLVTVTVVAGGETHAISGTVFGPCDVRIVDIDNYRMDLAPRGCVLFVSHLDRPGVIGLVGTLLGERGINIAGMQVGRLQVGGAAVMALMLDAPISDEALAEIGESEHLTDAMFVDFGSTE